MPFVLDNSVVTGWYLVDQATAYSQSIAIRLESDDALVPAPGQRQVFELAMQYKLSSYDAAYLELAMRHGLPLATQDAQLKSAAALAGVTVL